MSKYKKKKLYIFINAQILNQTHLKNLFHPHQNKDFFIKKKFVKISQISLEKILVD